MHPHGYNEILQKSARDKNKLTSKKSAAEAKEVNMLDGQGEKKNQIP